MIYSKRLKIGKLKNVLSSLADCRVYISEGLAYNIAIMCTDNLKNVSLDA